MTLKPKGIRAVLIPVVLALVLQVFTPLLSVANAAQDARSTMMQKITYAAIINCVAGAGSTIVDAGGVSGDFIKSGGFLTENDVALETGDLINAAMVDDATQSVLGLSGLSCSSGNNKLLNLVKTNLGVDLRSSDFLSKVVHRINIGNRDQCNGSCSVQDINVTILSGNSSAYKVHYDTNPALLNAVKNYINAQNPGFTTTLTDPEKYWIYYDLFTATCVASPNSAGVGFIEVFDAVSNGQKQFLKNLHYDDISLSVPSGVGLSGPLKCATMFDAIKDKNASLAKTVADTGQGNTDQSGSDQGGSGSNNNTNNNTNQQQPPTPTCDDPHGWCVGTTVCGAEGFSWLLCPLLRVLDSVVGGFMNWIQTQLGYNILVDNATPASGNQPSNADAIKSYWNAVVAIANIGFVLVFLVVIYSAATSTGLKNYDVKKILPRLVIAAILVNTSFWICAAISDLVNILGANIRGFLSSIIDNSIPWADNQSFFGALFSHDAGIGQGVTIILGGIVGVVLLIAFLGPLVLGLLLIVALLVFRQIAIIALIIISPIAFLLWLLPNTEKWFSKWLNEYVRMLFIYPAIMAVWGLTGFLTSIMTTIGGNGASLTTIGWFVKILSIIIVQFLPIAAIIPLFKMGGQIMGQLQGAAQKVTSSQPAQKIAQGINNRNRALMGGGFRWVAGDKGQAELSSEGKWVNSKTGKAITNGIMPWTKDRLNKLNNAQDSIEKAKQNIKNADLTIGNSKKDINNDFDFTKNTSTGMWEKPGEADKTDDEMDESKNAARRTIAEAEKAKELAQKDLENADARMFNLQDSSVKRNAFRGAAGTIGSLIVGADTFSKIGEAKIKAAQEQSTGAMQAQKVELNLKNSAQSLKNELEKQNYELRLKARESDIQHAADMMVNKAKFETGDTGSDFRTKEAALGKSPYNANIAAAFDSAQTTLKNEQQALIANVMQREEMKGKKFESYLSGSTPLDETMTQTFKSAGLRKADGSNFNLGDTLSLSNLKDYDVGTNALFVGHLNKLIANAKNDTELSDIKTDVETMRTAGTAGAAGINTVMPSIDAAFESQRRGLQAAAANSDKSKYNNIPTLGSGTSKIGNP